MAYVKKDPDSVEDYPVDWSRWLASGDAIASVEWVVPDGLTLATQSHTDTVATARLSGGTLSEGYDVVCRITTVGGETADYTLQVRMSEQ